MIKKATMRTIGIILAVVMILSAVGCNKADTWINDLPEYSGEAYAIINQNIPFFTDEELSIRELEYYSPLDKLGRCGVAFACISLYTMPDGERESIASITPTGWEYMGMSNNNQYSFVEDGYVYNRCHLIGYQLAGENDNPNNLVTGTRYMNIEGMLPFENRIAEFVRGGGGSVLYRVTPIFSGFNYVCDGVLMEAVSLDDGGQSICFCIFAYNVQPGVWIDYFTGVNIDASLKNGK